jgi:hypothetical protein
MNRSNFNEKFAEMQTAFGKRCNEALMELYYKKLVWIPDQTWSDICKEIIENDVHFPTISRFLQNKSIGIRNGIPPSCGQHGCSDGIVTLIDTETLLEWAAICPNGQCRASYFQSHNSKRFLEEVPMKRPHTNFKTDWLITEFNKLDEEKKLKYEKYIQKMINLTKKEARRVQD